MHACKSFDASRLTRTRVLFLCFVFSETLIVDLEEQDAAVDGNTYSLLVLQGSKKSYSNKPNKRVCLAFGSFAARRT